MFNWLLEVWFFPHNLCYVVFFSIICAFILREVQFSSVYYLLCAAHCFHIAFFHCFSSLHLYSAFFFTSSNLVLQQELKFRFILQDSSSPGYKMIDADGNSELRSMVFI